MYVNDRTNTQPSNKWRAFYFNVRATQQSAEEREGGGAHTKATGWIDRYVRHVPQPVNQPASLLVIIMLMTGQDSPPSSPLVLENSYPRIDWQTTTADTFCHYYDCLANRLQFIQITLLWRSHSPPHSTATRGFWAAASTGWWVMSKLCHPHRLLPVDMSLSN